MKNNKTNPGAKGTKGTDNGGHESSPVGTKIKFAKVIEFMVFLLWQGAEGERKSGRANGVVHLANGRMRRFTNPTVVRNSYTAVIRGFFSTFSSGFKALSQTDIRAWNAFSIATRDRLSRIIQKKGKQAYIALNSNLSITGQTNITSPPLVLLPVDAVNITDMTATVSTGLIKINYVPNTNQGIVMIFATSIQGAGISKPSQGKFRLIGNFDGTASSPVNIATDYTAKFTGLSGSAGSKIFLQLRTINADGVASAITSVNCVIVA